MNYTTFGKTGKNVSILGMGGMRFEKEIPEENCVEFIKYANKSGINYFDTAPIYNEDRSESIYGRAFKDMNRNDFFVATKGQNGLSASDMRQSIERSLKRLNIEQIDFFFLWAVIYFEQFEKATQKGQALEAIIKAREEGLIKHIGISTHTESVDIKKMVDYGFFEFIMIPYNALNFASRQAGIRHAKDKGLATIAMNPAYGGVIPEFKDQIQIFKESKNSAIEDALKFCFTSPDIDVALSGMNSFEMIDENINYASKYKAVRRDEHNKLQSLIEESNSNLCTACGYCLSHCPEEIDIRNYMEIYNIFELTNSKEATKKRYEWYHKFGPLHTATKKPADCTQCTNCEEECTQYLNIVERLEWLDKEFG